MATQIDADGTVREVAPADGRVFTLQELQAIVGGFIEAHPTPDGRVMFMNEDGKRLGLGLNREATARVLHTLRPGDVIVGSVVICTKAEAGDDEDDQ